MVEKFLPREMLSRWLDELSGHGRLFVPVQEGQAILFRPYVSGAEVVLDRQPTLPSKEVLFPRSEALFGYSFKQVPVKDSPDGETRIVKSVDLKPHKNQGQDIIFADRPCGTRGFLTFDPVFASGPRPDPLYSTRREKCVIITLACLTRENTCFCHWVGSSPVDTSGSDVFVTMLEEGFFMQAVSDRGKDLLQKSTVLTEPAQGVQSAVHSLHGRIVDDLPPAPDLDGVVQALDRRFTDLEFWQAVSAKCVSCGACTYLCPTCYCFNITDESQGNTGLRIRSWDNCLSYLYTLEASGHNPRPTKAHRLRNRINHKFCYYPKDYDQFACCGCGRCIKSCPAAVDIREIVLKAKEGLDESS